MLGLRRLKEETDAGMSVIVQGIKGACCIPVTTLALVLDSNSQRFHSKGNVFGVVR